MKKLSTWPVILLLLFCEQNCLAQLSGVINTYARVNSIVNKTIEFDNVSLSYLDPTVTDAFGAGNLVLLIQMKGAEVITSNDPTFGQIIDYHNAGNYEVAQVLSLTGTGPNYTIELATLFRSFDVSGQVQLVSVPSYTNVSVDGDVTALPWNPTSGTGGIVILDVADTLTLQADINVNARGFEGGRANSFNSSGCTSSIRYVSDGTAIYSAQKGESIADYAFNGIAGQEFARGAMSSGGGGANPHNAGGGGGSNYGTGGQGGDGWPGAGACPGNSNEGGGLGGHALNYDIVTDKIFMGGGGGGGQQNDSQGSRGGRGGGIIIIRAKNVNANCGSPETFDITAHGEKAPDSGGNDGAGGGGAGGVVYLEVDNFINGLPCSIDVAADGGDGGNVNATIRQGGGGGGGIGAILLRNPVTNPLVYIDSKPGEAGEDCVGAACTPTGEIGGDGPSGLPSQTGWGLDNSPSALPIRLQLFTAQAQENQVEVQWVTASEVNTEYFEIERSQNLKEISIATRVSALGANNRAQSYLWIDHAPFDGISYYRLKSVDTDGSTQYSGWVSVNIGQSLSYQVFPNPAQDQLFIQRAGDDLSKALVLLHDLRGQLMLEANMLGQITIDLRALPSGMYHLQIRDERGLFKKKIIIQH